MLFALLPIHLYGIKLFFFLTVYLITFFCKKICFENHRGTLKGESIMRYIGILGIFDLLILYCLFFGFLLIISLNQEDLDSSNLQSVYIIQMGFFTVSIFNRFVISSSDDKKSALNHLLKGELLIVLL